MEFAIRDKYDIVDLISGIDPSTIEPQVKAAKDAGVKVMTSHFYDPSDKQNPLVSSSLTIGFGEIGTILANWATVSTDGKANIVLIVSDEVPPTKPLVAGPQERTRRQLPELQDRAGDQRRRHRMGHEDPACGAIGGSGATPKSTSSFRSTIRCRSSWCRRFA